MTQPWRGAQENGASGFVKGVSKGIGGFLAKPGAVYLGILSHTMQGVSKEVQKLFGSDVLTYVVASRAAQGYEEWLQSSDEEKQEVITRWQQYETKPKTKSKSRRETKDAREPHLNRRWDDEMMRNDRLSASSTGAESEDAPQYQRNHTGENAFRGHREDNDKDGCTKVALMGRISDI